MSSATPTHSRRDSIVNSVSHAHLPDARHADSSEATATHAATPPAQSITPTEPTTTPACVARVDASTQTEEPPALPTDTQIGIRTRTADVSERKDAATQTDEPTPGNPHAEQDIEPPVPSGTQDDWPKAPDDWPEAPDGWGATDSDGSGGQHTPETTTEEQPGLETTGKEQPDSEITDEEQPDPSHPSAENSGSAAPDAAAPPSTSNDPPDSLGTTRLDSLNIAYCVTLPAFEQNLPETAKLLFPSLGRGDGKHGGWTDERWEVAHWVADGLELMKEGGEVWGDVICRPNKPGFAQPVAYSRFQWEFGSEAKEATARSDQASRLLGNNSDERKLAQLKELAPSTMNVREWVRFCTTLNNMREDIYERFGLADILICRPLQLFVRPDACRQGHGSALMQRACHVMDERRALGFVLAPNMDVVRFYTKFDFKRVGKFSQRVGTFHGMIRVPANGGPVTDRFPTRLERYKKAIAALRPRPTRGLPDSAVVDQVQLAIQTAARHGLISARDNLVQSVSTRVAGVGDLNGATIRITGDLSRVEQDRGMYDLRVNGKRLVNGVLLEDESGPSSEGNPDNAGESAEAGPSGERIRIEIEIPVEGKKENKKKRRRERKGKE